MTPHADRRSSSSRALTLGRLMGAVAASAVFFAVLPLDAAVPMAVAVFGVLIAEGMGLPVVTDAGGVRTWLPWVVWLVFLMVCPVASYVVAVMYRHVGPPVYPWPPATRVVKELYQAHLAVSVVAAVAVVVLTRGAWRWGAWAVVLVVGVAAVVVCALGEMATSGYHL